LVAGGVAPAGASAAVVSASAAVMASAPASTALTGPNAMLVAAALAVGALATSPMATPDASIPPSAIEKAVEVESLFAPPRDACLLSLEVGSSDGRMSKGKCVVMSVHPNKGPRRLRRDPIHPIQQPHDRLDGPS
jgi:hypothetical protein